MWASISRCVGARGAFRTLGPSPRPSSGRPFFQDFDLRFLQDFDLWFVFIDPFHLRIAMMAQAVSSCNLLLSCRV